MTAWFESRKLDRDGNLAELAANGRRVYVWGIGIHIQMMLGMSPLRDCNLVGCVDQDPQLQGRSIAQWPILPVCTLENATDQDVVVVGSVIHRQQMLHHLRHELKFSGRVVTV